MPVDYSCFYALFSINDKPFYINIKIDELNLQSSIIKEVRNIAKYLPNNGIGIYIMISYIKEEYQIDLLDTKLIQNNYVVYNKIKRIK